MADTASRYRIKEARVQRAEFNNTVWRASVEKGTPLDAILAPDFWAHVAASKNFQAGDEIKVQPDDGSWWAHLLVQDAGANWAKVALLLKAEFEKVETQNISADGFHVEWQGIAAKHAVIRDSDKAVISSGHKKATDAQIAMLEHIRGLSR